VAEVSPVLQALYAGDHAQVATLRPPADQLDLFEAAALGEAPRVSELLDADPARISTFSVDGFTPLHLAAYFGRPEVVDVLLERGTPLELYARADFARVTPLGSASAAGQTAVVRRLIDAGADVTAEGELGGFTPLHAAAANGDPELVNLLLEHGADAAAPADDGRTPRDLAATDEIRALLA
jgi:ankyrin repeat protein